MVAERMVKNAFDDVGISAVTDVSGQPQLLPLCMPKQSFNVKEVATSQHLLLVQKSFHQPHSINHEQGLS